MLDCGLPPDSRSAREKICRRVLVIGDNLIVRAAFAVAPFLSPASEFSLSLQADPVTAIGSMAVVIVSLLLVLALALLNSGYSWFERIQQISLSLGAVFLLEALLSYVHFAWLLELYDAFLGSVLCECRWWTGTSFSVSFFPGSPPSGGCFCSERMWLFRRSRKSGHRVSSVLGPFPYPEDIRTARELAPDEIVVGDVAAGTFPASALLDLRFRGVTIHDAATFFESTLQRVSCRHLQPVRFLYGEMTPKRQKLALQAVYSNVLGLAALAIAVPVMVIAPSR